MLFETFKRNRKERPNAPAFLVTAGDRYLPVSWKQYTDGIATVCWIIEKHTPGARIAILGENSYEWMVVHAACLFSGAVAVSLDTNLNADDIAKRLQFVGATILLHSSLYADKAHAVADRMPGLMTGGFGTPKTDFFIAAASSALQLLSKTIWDKESVDVERTSLMIFTSGTTSEPRAVEQTIRAVETTCESWISAMELKEGQRSLMLLPLHHIFGICATYAMLVAGVALGVCPDFRRIYDAAVRFRINFAFLVPALAEVLAAKIERNGKTAEEACGGPIEWIGTGGAPISRRLYERLTALGIRMHGVYGLTETCALFSIGTLAEEIRPCTAGKRCLLANVETTVSPEGELLVRGPNVMKGYYKMPERTAKAIDKDGWFHTGDRGSIDADGFVWVTGRASRTIVLSSGKKIAPEELEEKLHSLPGVLEALVSGEGESRDVRAEIYASVSEERVHALVQALNKTLPVYQRIKRVVVRAEPFPRTSSGKIKLG